MHPDKTYRVKGWSGIAFGFLGYADDAEETAVVYMVGDDETHKVKVSDCTPLSDDEFCLSCGQIGCCHN